ncbi:MULTISPECIES: MBL fold metallo-hydrolase RNA specificity domain-containing protein [Flavobacterium]|uniref:MBL fold metallo-hydrolase RNA specificity domain-containing protein n=1 Tax=Flavobacterium TaxID=237 RepID=UPI001FCBC1C2|nr:MULTISPECIES: MBL fold metallo-hydrolase [Flavobacterium]UOK42298.1 MBL fold metallo-hydrolase [Flavobacterium enshiense]
MDVSILFLGAASEVTGSKYLLKIDHFNLLVDCGLFQGKRKLKELNWTELPIKPEEINAVIITHAHTDHTGYLPRLIRLGYRNPVYCTTATADLMHLMLMDAAKFQVEDAEFAKKKGYSKHKNPEPLFTQKDVECIQPILKTASFEETIQITEQIAVTFYNAGHVLGASIVEITLTGDTETKKIVFSGDLGRYNDPLLYPPKTIDYADVLLVESTYGDKAIKQTDRNDIIELMNETFEKDGNLIVPAFAIGRTQTLLMYLKNVMMTKEIPLIKIAVDSPMAISATALYRKHSDYHKLKDIDLEDDEAFMTLKECLIISKTPDDSKKINDITQDLVIIAGNGMMSGGRIMHHLSRRLSDPKNVVLIPGYQAEGSKGRLLQEGAKTIWIFGQEIEVNAKIFTLHGLSAHADRNELLQWLSGFKQAPMKTFVIHGEKESAGALCETLKEQGWDAQVPHYMDKIELFKNI